MLSKKGSKVIKSLLYIFPTLNYRVLEDRDDDWVRLYFDNRTKYLDVYILEDYDEILRRLVALLMKDCSEE